MARHFRQLIARGLLSVDLEGHGALRLTPACRPVLRGEETLWLRREPKKIKGAKKKAPFQSSKEGSPRGASAGQFSTNSDTLLWEALRARRRELAVEQGVPPYVVFHDATLTQMVERRPQTPQDFAEISGVGKHKLAAYGKAFLAVICAHAVSCPE